MPARRRAVPAADSKSRVRERLRVRTALVTLAVGLAGPGCSRFGISLDDAKQDPFGVQLQIVSDPGVPLAGAEILSGTKVAGKTDAEGVARMRISGKEGEQVELTVRCPTDYESPPNPLVIPLRRLAPGSPLPHFEARCPPSLRTLVIGVRAENGANLPVVHLGRVVARTDESGAAVFTMRVRPSDVVEVVLSTADKAAEQLRPQSPKLTLVAPDGDDFVILDENFTVEKKPVHFVPKPPDHRPKPL